MPLTHITSTAQALVPKALTTAGSDVQRRATLVVLFSIALAGWGPIMGGLFWLLGLPLGAWTCAVGVVTVLATIAVMRRTGSLSWAGNWLAAQMFLIVLLCSLEVGGVSSSAVAWNAAVPVFATMIVGRRSGAAWIGLVVLEHGLMTFAQVGGWLPGSPLAPVAQAVYDLAVTSGAAMLLMSLAWLYEAEKDRAMDAVETARERAERAHAASRRILDNVSEGLVMVDLSGALLPGRSAAIDQWFGLPSSDATLQDWLRPHDDAFSDMLELGLMQLEEGFMPEDLLLDQLPRHLTSGERHYRLQFCPLHRDGELHRLLVTLSDVTAEMAARGAQRAQEDLAEVVRCYASDPKGVLAFYKEAQELVRDIAEPSDATELARSLHTLKGGGSLMGMRQLAGLIHDAEQRVLDEGVCPGGCDDVLDHWTEIEAVLGPILGPSGEEFTTLPRQALVDLADHLDRSDVRAARDWANDRLTEPVSTPLERLAAASRALAERLGLPTLRHEVQASSVRLDPVRWRPFWASMAHVVRNCVDHGIEAPDDRVAVGKPMEGTLIFQAHADHDELEIVVGDDGRGIDWARVRQSAAERGLPCDTPGQLQAALFADGLSTRDEATALSGRGVGLAAVQDLVARWGGHIVVDTRRGEGTLFRFVFPVRKALQLAG